MRRRLEGVFLVAPVWLDVGESGSSRPRRWFRAKLRVLAGPHENAAIWITVSRDWAQPGVLSLLSSWGRAVGARALGVDTREQLAATFLGKPFKAAVVTEHGRHGDTSRLARVEDATAWTEAERERAESWAELWRLRGGRESE